MPDDSWVKRVVEDQRRLAEHQAAEERRRAEIQRLAAVFWTAFVVELQRVLDEYHGYDGAIAVESREDLKAMDPESLFALKCRAQPALSWSFAVNPVAAVAQAVWTVRNGNEEPTLEHRTLRLGTADGQLLWDGVTKGPAVVAQEVLEPWLRRLVQPIRS